VIEFWKNKKNQKEGKKKCDCREEVSRSRTRKNYPDKKKAAWKQRTQIHGVRNGGRGLGKRKRERGKPKNREVGKVASKKRQPKSPGVQKTENIYCLKLTAWY